MTAPARRRTPPPVKPLLLSALALLLAVSVSACDDGAIDGSSSGSSSSSGTGGAACEPGSHTTPNGCEATLASWTAAPSLVKGRDHHATFAATSPAGTFLYTMVGASASGSADSTVERAAIAEDGSLGAFEKIGNTPKGLIGPGFAQLDRSFVLAGGLGSDGNSTPSTFVGQVGDDGAVTFTAGPDLTKSRYHVSLSYAKGYVYAIGGLFQDVSSGTPDQTVEAAVERASFDGTTLGAWTTLAPLPAPTTHHAAVSFDGALWLIGGGSGAAAKTSILRSAVADDGSLGDWIEVGVLPEGRATSSALVFLDQLYVVAGMTSLTGGEVATVLRAPIADGAVGAFEELAPLPKARAHAHQTPLVNGHLYNVGGSIHHAVQKDVFVGLLE